MPQEKVGMPAIPVLTDWKKTPTNVESQQRTNLLTFVPR